MERADAVLTVEQMRAAEDALMAGGISVHELMQRAGRGAADWIWRMAGRHPVTVLCGPGNNGGDGYVIAEALRERGGQVSVVAAAPPRTDAALRARALYQGTVVEAAAVPPGDVLVDCLFGSGLRRPLSDELLALLQGLGAIHTRVVAMDVPSGVETNTGLPLNPGLPENALTIALGAWKPAHFLMPAAARMGRLVLVDIGCTPPAGAARLLGRPRLAAPAADAHKYRRGLVVVVAGAMPGAALLSAIAAQGAGAGYVKLLASGDAAVPADIVTDHTPLAEGLVDRRIGAVLVGPGLGRGAESRARLEAALGSGHPLVIDADALSLLDGKQLNGNVIATPHEGELAALEQAFGLAGAGSKIARVQALAEAGGMVVIAKGPDTVIAEPGGRAALAARASSWLSVAGTGDVLAGLVAARLAGGSAAFAAACEAVWLHGEAARLAGPAFSASRLASMVPAAYAACL